MGRLNGKVAIITGGTSGMGQTTALLWAKEGAKVVVIGRNAERGEKTNKMIQEAGGEATFVRADVSKEEDVENMVKATVAKYGKLDIIFNNAAIVGPRGAKVENISEEDIYKLIAINYVGVIFGTKYAIKEMLNTGGGVVLNTASDSAFVGTRGLSVYNGTKGAVLAFSRGVAMDYVWDDIRVNTISPCLTRTPIHDEFLVNEENIARFKEFEEQIPMGRACEPEDIAYAALFLVSDEAKMITGTNLMVDGGFLAKGFNWTRDRQTF
jgi:NAD(P)-dependent dehydrogenase (short-subunit alcohol dehydrogenase family)